MEGFVYHPRLTDQLLRERLEEVGAVLVQGPKWCGKTTTCSQLAGSRLMLADLEVYRRSSLIAQTDIKLLLEGARPRLFDEWQTIPALWDAVRNDVDRLGQTEGSFILTGSTSSDQSVETLHSGTGRFAWLKMRTMSLFESGDSTGEVSLEKLFDDVKTVRGNTSHTIHDIAFLICRGGWPSAIGKSERVALRVAFNYFDALVEKDLPRIDKSLSNTKRSRLLLRSIARLQGSHASQNIVRQDVAANDNEHLSEALVSAYFNALNRLFVEDDLSAWSTNLRSKTAIRTADTRYFTDPSIAVAALGTTPTKLLKDLETMGFLFETMCIRDLRAYADVFDAKVYHYRDKDELECDAVIELRDGTYGLVEIKLGGTTAIESAAKSLWKLQNKINTDKVGLPAFRMVIVGVGNYAYTLSDGTHVVPIGCLKP